MTTRQQQRARQHQQRHQRPPVSPAETMPPIVKGREGLRRFRDACDAYETDMTAAFRVRQDAIDEARADCQRKIAAAEAEYDRAHDAAADAYAQRAADSHEPEPPQDEPAETDTAAEQPDAAG